MIDDKVDDISKYKDLVYKKKINESLNLLDQMIANDNNNVYALQEKGFAKLFLHTDSSYNIDIIINDFKTSLFYVFKAIEVSDDKKKTLKLSYLKLIDQIIKYYLIFPKLVIIPYDLFMDKYSVSLVEFEIDKTTSLDLLYNDINTYIITNHKIHGIKFSYIKELRDAIDLLLKQEISNKVKIYWTHHKLDEIEIMNKREILEFELQKIKIDYMNSDIYREVQRLTENYKKIFINSREYKDKSDIKDYINEKEIAKSVKELYLYETELNKTSLEIQLKCSELQNKISYFDNLINTGEFHYVKIFDKILKSKRLTLRRINDFDYLNMYEYAKKPGFGEKAGWPYHKNIEDSKEVVRNLCFLNTIFAVVLSKINKMIGTISYEEINYKKFSMEDKYGFEIGYALSDNYSNNGYMTEAVSSLLDFLFYEIKVDYVICGHFLGNLPSKRVIEKTGFVYLKDIFVKSCNRTVKYYIKFK